MKVVSEMSNPFIGALDETAPVVTDRSKEILERLTMFVDTLNSKVSSGRSMHAEIEGALKLPPSYRITVHVSHDLVKGLPKYTDTLFRVHLSTNGYPVIVELPFEDPVPVECLEPPYEVVCSNLNELDNALLRNIRNKDFQARLVSLSALARKIT